MTTQSIQTICLAIIALAAMIIPFAIIHELGHSLVCHLNGNKFEIDIQFFTPSSMICLGTLTNSDIFRASGGALASTIAGICGIAVKPKFLKIALFSIALAHLVNMVVESQLYDSYMGDAYWPILFGLIDSVIFIGVVFSMMKKTVII